MILKVGLQRAALQTTPVMAGQKRVFARDVPGIHVFFA
jgi:hypothetical protein